MKRIGIIGAALFAAGALWAEGEPSVTLTRVQQRYPWNGKVDIDFTVDGVNNPDDYYVRLRIVKPGGSAVTLHEFEDDAKLYAPTNGANQRVTWDSSWEDQECRFLGKNSTVQAELVFCGGQKQNAPYGARYVVVDLSNSESYPVTNLVFHSQAAANEFFNTDEFKDSKMAFRRIRCGSFMMGSPTNETGRTTISGTTATPGSRMGETQHKVTLTENFLIGVFPLTTRQWERITGLTCTSTDYGNGKYGARSWDAGGNNVSWDNIRGNHTNLPAGDPTSNSPLGLLNARVKAADPNTRLKFDLPTDSQWEYACRAGTAGAIYNASIDYTNWDQLKEILRGVSADHPRIVKVGTRDPNPWGLYDMLGLVYEICLDRVPDEWHDWGEGALVDPFLDSKTTQIVVRGGAYLVESGMTEGSADWVSAFRSAMRHKQTTVYVGTQLGVRFACTLRDGGTN